MGVSIGEMVKKIKRGENGDKTSGGPVLHIKKKLKKGVGENRWRSNVVRNGQSGKGKKEEGGEGGSPREAAITLLIISWIKENEGKGKRLVKT